MDKHILRTAYDIIAIFLKNNRVTKNIERPGYYFSLEETKRQGNYMQCLTLD